MILAGDIGGTKTNIAFFEDAKRPDVVAQETFPSRAHAGLEEIVRRFISQHALRVRHAAFGVAGPVRNGRCEATNLPWVVDAVTLAAELGIRDVWVINDLEANAYGIAALGPEDLVTINKGAANGAGNAAIIAAGTGLGEAGLYWDGRTHHPFATEGGHANFGPGDAVEAELLQWFVQPARSRQRGGHDRHGRGPARVRSCSSSLSFGAIRVTRRAAAPAEGDLLRPAPRTRTPPR